MGEDDQRMRALTLGQAQPGAQRGAVLCGRGDLGEGADGRDGVSRIRQLVHLAGGGVDAHRVGGHGDPGGRGDDRAAGDGGRGEGEVLARAAREATRCGIREPADPDGAAALVVARGDEGVLVEPDRGDPVVQLGPHRRGIAGGEVQQLDGAGEARLRGPGALAAEEDVRAVGAELAGAELELCGGLAQELRGLGTDEVEQVEVGGAEQVPARILHRGQRAGSGPVHGPAHQAAGGHGQVAEVQHLLAGGCRPPSQRRPRCPSRRGRWRRRRRGPRGGWRSRARGGWGPGRGPSSGWGSRSGGRR